MTITKTPKKAALGFTSTTKLNLLKPLTDKFNPIKTHLNVVDSIAFTQINSKFHYDGKHQLIIFAVRDNVLLRLYKGYNILSIPNRKSD